MEIKTARFVMSNSDVKKCPEPNKPEFAFIGRSNVGKSSLINMLTGQKKLAKTSSRPGKTQLINHFLINEDWFLVDLPGYGYAKVSKKSKEKFQAYIVNYILQRENLYCLFVLVDARHEPQKIDMEFINWLGEKEVPFALVFTKADKLGRTKLDKNLAAYKAELLKDWAELPPLLVSSAEAGVGKEDILSFIEQNV
ncbi:ribosome biogenesis GTP-binding protein YihA/YsxC [Sunxiuqinia elliptica]|uniref:Probable GTP-binding protein EngB n=1 Tax=Sunxiuqinia elliptica TaxID=655355 RepID=A0A4V3BZ61_9BACT|nr:ribosome biogenesis GTP-binding protein YihA/YsxC [Sunxiuqinia elliptica]TDO05339.1 GTP-binding protein [Sunxiuqinia elliptica]TDO64888.1 GTP-binding protein [Sunxiuqinia elliptica]